MQKYNFRPRRKMPTGTPENSSNPENGNLQAEIMATFQEKNEEIEALKLRVEAEKQRQEEKEEELNVMRQRLQALQQEHITQQQEIQEQQLQIQQHQHHEQQRQQRQTLQQQQQREFLPPPPPPPMPQHTLQRSVTAPAESHIRQLSNIKLEKFDGKTSAVQWWMKFMAFISLQKLSEQTAILHLPFFLIGAAETWFNSLDTIKKLTLNSIHEAFINRFKPPSNHVFDLLELQQGPTESVEEFIHRVTEKATDLKMDTNQTMGKIMRGLKPKIKADMVKVNPTNMEDLRTHAMLAEMAQSICSDDAVQSATGAAMCNALTSLEQRMSALETSNINVLQETRRFNSPAKQKPYFSNNQNQSQRGPQRHGYREADQQKNMGSRPRQSQQCFRCAPLRGILHSFMFLLVALLVLDTASSSSIKTKENIIHRINYGVLFKEEPNIILAQEYWLNTFRIPLPKRFAIPQQVLKCPQSEQYCMTYNNIARFIRSLHVEVMNHYNETMQSIRVLIPSVDLKVQQRRQTRSLLPFVGSLSKSLFGTATMDDVNILASHINMLTRHTNQMAKLLVQHNDHLSSFMQLTDSRINNLKNGIKNNAQAISLLANKLSNIDQLVATVTNFSEILVNQVNKVTVFKNRLDKLETSIQTLVEGKLSPFLISKTLLMHTIRQISSLLRKSYKGFELVHTDPSYFYSEGQFVYARQGTTLYVTIKFPISSQQSSMPLYKVVSMPVPMSSNASTGQATQLLSLPDYFAITQHHDKYIQLKEKDLINCQQDKTVVCNTNYALTPITKNSCILALYFNNAKDVHRHCQFRYLQGYTFEPSIVELTPTSVLLYHSPRISLDCPSEQKMLPGCQFCILNIPCRCSLQTSSLYFAPRLVNCYNQTKSFSVAHPVNLALLQEFFEHSKLSHIWPNSTFSNPVSFSIPEFQLFNHSFNQVLVNDAKSHLNLTKMVQATIKEKKIFQHLAEPLIDGEIDITPPWPSTNDILTMVAISIAVLALACSILLFCKLRKMHIALMLLQSVQQVKSEVATNPSFNLVYNRLTTTAPETAESSNSWLKDEFSLLHASVISGILCFILIIIIFMWLYRRKYKKHTFLALELTSGGDCVLLPIMHLSLCPSYYDIPTPNIGDISISPFPYNKVYANWLHFGITDKRTEKTIFVPTVISTNIFRGYKITQILKQPFSAYVVLIHHNYAHALN